MSKFIVIVEDCETIAPLEIALASLEGTVLRHFSNGRDAIRFLQDGNDVFALVTDLNVPVMDGFQLIETIRGEARHANLPIIVVSGNVDPSTPGRLRELGVNAFFAKPYSPGKVRDTLEALLYVK